MTDSTRTFKISPNWGCVRSFDDLVSDAKFVFVHSAYKGYRPHIVLKTPLENGFDTIEIDHDRYGLITNGVSVFNDGWGEIIVDSGNDPIAFVRNFLINTGASDLLVNA